MKFGLFGGVMVDRGEGSVDSRGYDDFVEMAVEAEALGFHSLFLVEHHFSGSGQISASLNLLSYLAAKTTTLRLGTAVTVLPWHNPVLLAEQAATLDLLSRGRLDFGVGKGYRDIEFKGFRIPREEALDRYREALEVILKAWSSDRRFNHRGRYWSFDDIVVEPAPFQKPHPPIWTGAGTDDSIRRVAEAGRCVLFDQFATFSRTEERLDVWRVGLAAAGRAYDPMAVGLTRSIAITRNAVQHEAALEQRRRRVASMTRAFGSLPGQERTRQPETYADDLLAQNDAAIIGDCEAVVGRLRVLAGMGFGYVLLLIPNDIETLRIFASEIMPELAASEALAAE